MKRNVRRLLFVLGVVTGLLVGGVVVVLSFGRTPPASPLPNPNGYDDLLKAGRVVTMNVDAHTHLDREGLRALIATNAEALRLLREGLTHRCVIPTDAQIANFAAISRDLIGLKSLARVLSAGGRSPAAAVRPL